MILRIGFVGLTAAVLLATELRAAHTYWQVQSNSDIYPEAFQEHNKVVGILWTHLAQRQTWFGAAPYLVHGIQVIHLVFVMHSDSKYSQTCVFSLSQVLPSTPINDHLLNRDWVAKVRVVSVVFFVNSHMN